MSRKAVKDFELTLAQCKLDKHHVYYALDELCLGLIVAQEVHHPCPTFSEGQVERENHYHCYLQFEIGVTIEEIRPTIASTLGGGEAYEGSIHLSSLRNRVHWIKYCTKEDTTPLYRGVDASLFHFAYRMHDYICRNPKFNSLDVFIRQNIQYTNIIRKAHAEYHSDRTRKGLLETRTVYPDVGVKWVREALEALYAGKHLLLWGDTGIGKSVTVKYFLEVKYQLQDVAYLPCGDNSFEFSQLDDNTCVAYADDINTDYLVKHRQCVLRLLDGGLCTINPKCDRIRQFTCKAQFIFASNYNCIECTDTAVLRRLCVIHAVGNGFSETPPSRPAEAQTVSTENCPSTETEGDSSPQNGF